MKEGNQLHTTLLRGKLPPVTTEKESGWNETVCTFSRRGNSLTPAFRGRGSMSQMVRQIKMWPITLSRAWQHHTLTWWPIHSRSAKTCGCKPLYVLWRCCVYKYGVQFATGGINTDVNCKKNCSALLISWRICAAKSFRLRLSFGWSAFEVGSQQKTDTSSTSCEQQSSHSVGGLCICTLIYLRCEQSFSRNFSNRRLSWTLSAQWTQSSVTAYYWQMFSCASGSLNMRQYSRFTQITLVLCHP